MIIYELRGFYVKTGQLIGARQPTPLFLPSLDFFVGI